MRLRDIKRELTEKGLKAAEVLKGWATLVPEGDVYFVAADGSIRRHDVRVAGGRREFRDQKRARRRAKIIALKVRQG